jgi:tetratricopeptide (TPR) repeat protein
MFNFELASLFVKSDLDLATAETAAQSGVALYDKSDCLEDDRYVAEERHVYDEKSAKHPVPFTYHIEDGEEHCAAGSASRYSLLGKIQAKLGNTEAAQDNFQKALALHPDMTAALGMATIDEAKGDKPAALEMMTVAYLTGALPPEDIVKAKALYAELHPGSGPEAFNEMVGQRYAKTFVNPVKDSGPPPQPAHPQHVVLEELFTGAGCEPCMAPDLATEAALHRYTRDQLVIAIYHNNAPDSDPLTNDTGEARAKYYATGGSTPHVFVDGKERELEEGQPSHAQSSFDLLTKIVDPLLAQPSDATLNVKADRHGDTVDVDLTGSAKTLPAKTHLEILLVETEVGYSGRNTLHFQPMVVRASAGLKDHDTGLAIASAAAIPQHYSFDLKKIEAANLAYYDEFRVYLEKRMERFMTPGGMTKAEVDKMAAFPEQKNLIHPDRLAVIAFLQADDSKKVLQAVYVPVTGATEGEQK